MFGKRLAELRNNIGISQYELAARMNLSRGQIANYEQGTREPDFATLIALADFFEISSDCLLGRDDQSYIKKHEEFTNVAFWGPDKENLTEEEAEFLKGSLHLLRKFNRTGNDS